MADGKGLRYTEGKERVDLIPPEAILALGDHYRVGSDKYLERNWERGMAWSKCYASLQRHALKWQSGEDYDEETGTHHMIAVAWNAIALFIYAIRNIGQDDRVKASYVNPPSARQGTPSAPPFGPLNKRPAPAEVPSTGGTSSPWTAP